MLSKILGAFTFGLMVVALVQLLGYLTSEELIRSFRNVEQMQTTLLRLKDTESLLKDVQRSHRGYIISEEEEFLAPYKAASSQLPSASLTRASFSFFTRVPKRP